ncbi:MAG: hypothetical protein KBD21_02930 [Candidatus Pacebacteria bacterium]|nr:hypothetical protein [Candidatus Paceibacterota bacterium]
MNPNDPNDYRVPVLRLGDFFEDENKKPAEYGDSSVTGFDWSTAPVTANTNATSTNTATTGDITTGAMHDSEQSPQVGDVPAVIKQHAVLSHENTGVSKAVTEDTRLPPQETDLAAPRVAPCVPKSQTMVPKRDTSLSPLTQYIIPRNSTPSPQTPPQIDTAATNEHGGSGLPATPHSPHTSVQSSSPSSTPVKHRPTDIVDTAVPDEPLPIHVAPKPSESAPDIVPRSALPTIPAVAHTTPDLSPANSAAGPNILTQPKSQSEPLRTDAGTALFSSTTPQNTKIWPEPHTPLVTASHILNPHSVTTKLADDVWTALEQKMSPGLPRRPAATPIQPIIQTSHTDDAALSEDTQRDFLSEPVRTSSSFDINESLLEVPDDIPSQNAPTSTPPPPVEPAPTVVHAPQTATIDSQIEPLDIWATPATSLQEIVERHAPSRHEEASFVEKTNEVEIAPTYTPSPETPIVPTPPVPIVERPAPANDLAQLRARVSQLHTAHAPVTPSSEQEAPTAPRDRRSELARTDVQALQRGIALLGSMPDEESDTTTTQKDDTTVRGIRTIQSDIQASTALEMPSAPMPRPELPATSATPAMTAPSLMRTFKQDVEQAVNQRGPSLVQMVAAQENARGTNDIHARNSVSRISPGMFVLLGTAVILILSSIGVGAWLYFSQAKSDTATTRSVIESDSVMSINITGKTRSEIMRDLAQARSTLKRSKGEIVRFIPVEEKMDTASDSKVQNQLSAEAFLARINSQAHGTLTGNIERDFTLGVLVQNENIPFIIFLSKSSQLTNDGMLDWEPDMEDDLSPFFMLGSTDDREDAKKAGIVPFEDATVANMRVRIRKNETGATVLAWAVSDQYIIITQNETALAALLERVRVGSITQTRQ